MGVPAPGLKGGPPTHLPQLVQYFADDNSFDIKTFYYGSRKHAANESGISKISNNLFILSQFIKLVITYKPDVIHINSAFDKRSIVRDVPFSIVSKILRKSLIFKIHGSHHGLLFTDSKIMRLLISIYFWGANKVGVLSEYEKNEFIQQFGNHKKLVVVKNIVSQNFKTESLHGTTKKYDALFVSRIEKGKGLEDLIMSMPKIVINIPNFLVAVAGTGSNLESCKKLAITLGVQQRIVWLGHIKNNMLSEIFDQSKMFVFTSHFPEGMPMSMIEAMLNGLPVVTTKTRFAVSYLKEPANIIFVKKNDPNDLAEKIVWLINNSSLWEKMKMNNIDFLRNFSKEQIGQEFSSIYHEMTNKKFIKIQ
jgi:glycosyltransferase involved in cell wall biosynthesis